MQKERSKKMSEERRRFPRISEEISLKLHLDDFDAVAHTLNISASGIYCKVDKEIPLMSRLKLILMIPSFLRDDAGVKKVEVTGVVVREHPVIIDGSIRHYDVAIFFEDLLPKDREIISGYISNKKT